MHFLFKEVKKIFAFFSLFQFILVLQLLAQDGNLLKKIKLGCPDWMHTQIRADLSSFENEIISLIKLNSFFSEMPSDTFLAKFTIKANRIYIEKKISWSCTDYRIKAYEEALKDLSESVTLPDVTFFLFLHDGLAVHSSYDQSLYSKFPLFVMSRANPHGCDTRSILVPDYEALHAAYQVIKNVDITTYCLDWKRKKPTLVWRGTIGQSAIDFSGRELQPETIHLFSRVTLSELSSNFSDLINAKFTFLGDLDQTVPIIKKYKGEWMPFEEQCSYKYQILINGGVASYSNSCWRFFSNSVVFIPDSGWTQWYYGALEPYVNFIPVESNLDNLVDKILWARENDQACKKIAKNTMKFARNNLTRSDHLVYLYFLLEKYSKLNFTD